MPGEIINLAELKDKILKLDNVLIIPHINPDPDALGSALGLKWIFGRLGKRAFVVCDTKINERMCGYFNIEPNLDLDLILERGFDYIICVDMAAESMLGRSLEKYGGSIDYVIDHHYTNSLYGHETYLDSNAAATGEIIFDLAYELGLANELDKKFANYIYCAIACDSGSFRYSSTTAKTMRAAAELIERTGFDFAKLNRMIFQNKTLEQISVERLAYNTLEIYLNGKAAVINITREIKRQAGLENLENFEFDGLSDIARIVAGVEVGVVIKETENDDVLDFDQREFKVSLRSNDYVNVAEIASKFGGGGHQRAAGCKFKFSQEELKELLSEKFKNLSPEKFIEEKILAEIERVL